MPVTVSEAALDIREKLVVEDSRGFAAWLEHSGPLAREIWVVFYKKTSGKSGMKYEDAVREALRYGWIDGQMKSIDGETYAIRFSPRRKKSAWSATNRETARDLLQSGQMTPAGVAALPADMQADREYDGPTPV